jgi:hypothetical protein
MSAARASAAEERRILQRETFHTFRLLEFCSERELIKQIGHGTEQWPLVDNAIDAAEEVGAAPVIRIEITDKTIVIADNGPGMRQLRASISPPAARAYPPAANRRKNERKSRNGHATKGNGNDYADKCSHTAGHGSGKYRQRGRTRWRLRQGAQIRKG